jgi:hypothetical protein
MLGRLRDPLAPSFVNVKASQPPNDSGISRRSPLIGIEYNTKADERSWKVMQSFSDEIFV